MSQRNIKRYWVCGTRKGCYNKRKFLRPKEAIGDENMITKVKCEMIKVSREKSRLYKNAWGSKCHLSSKTRQWRNVFTVLREKLFLPRILNPVKLMTIWESKIKICTVSKQIYFP